MVQPLRAGSAQDRPLAGGRARRGEDVVSRLFFSPAWLAQRFRSPTPQKGCPGNAGPSAARSSPCQPPLGRGELWCSGRRQPHQALCRGLFPNTISRFVHKAASSRKEL